MKQKQEKQAPDPGLGKRVADLEKQVAELQKIVSTLFEKK